MKTTKTLLFLTVLMLAIVSPINFSQDESSYKHFGLSALIQDAQFDILLPIVLKNTGVIAPAVGVASVSEAGTDISLGLVGRFYLKDSKVKPFLGGRFGALIFSPSKPEGSSVDSKSTTDFILGFLAGGEYFLDEGFSIGVEAQLNASVSDKNSSRFGNPDGVNINTGAAVFATVYF